MRWRRLPALCVVGALSAFRGADGGEPPKPVGAVKPREAKIEDRPFWVSVPISNESNLCVALAKHYWLRRSPLSSQPTSLAGDGVVLQYVDDLKNGGYRSVVYVGCVPMPEAREREALDDRVDRGFLEFTSTLAEKYKRHAQQLLTDPADLKLTKATISIDGRKCPAVRTTTYNTRSASSSTRLDLLRIGEAILFHLAGSDRITYVVVDSAQGGVALDDVLGALTTRKSTACSRQGRVAKIVETSLGPDKAAAVRFVTYDEPMCFVPNFSLEGRDEYVYVADRIEETGAVTASYRIRNRRAEKSATLAAEAAAEMEAMDVRAPEAPERVGLSTPGGEAVIYAYPGTWRHAACAANTAVFRVGDQIWSFTWYSLCDDARVSADRAAFVQLLAGLEILVR